MDECEGVEDGQAVIKRKTRSKSKVRYSCGWGSEDTNGENEEKMEHIASI